MHCSPIGLLRSFGSRTNRARPHSAACVPNEQTLPDLDFSGADDGIRTRDPHLGKVMLYQLSHVRVTPECSKVTISHPLHPGAG